MVVGRWASVAWVQSLVATGFLGAFTTMSAFALDVIELDEAVVSLPVFLIVNLGGGLAAFGLARRAASS